MKKITVFFVLIACLLFSLTVLATEKPISCVPAGQPVLSASSLTSCGGQVVTLSVASGNLNDSAHWAWYADSCEGTAIGNGASIQVSPAITTTYYARGEGGCAANGECGSIAITVLPSLISGAMLPFVTNGFAGATGSNCYNLTTGLSQRSSAWYPTQLNLNYDFDLRFTKNQCGSADGMMFVLQRSGTNALGGLGSDLGYYAATDPGTFSQSLGVEFDLYNSDASYYDPGYQHISIVKNGSAEPVVPQIQTTLSSCESEAIRFTWNHITQVFSVYYNNALMSSYTSDLVNTVFGGDPKVYMGFTGSTGGESATQSFCVDSMDFKHELQLQTTYLCDSATIGSNASGAGQYLWSTGETTPTIIVTESGTYSLTVSNGSCSETASATIVLGNHPVFTYNGVPNAYPIAETIATLIPVQASNPVLYYSINPALPSGMSINIETGEISGTPLLATPPTEYTITGTNSCGSWDTTISFATVCSGNTTPFANITILGNNTVICEGESVVLRGSLNSQGLTYLWSTGATTRTISVNTSGSYKVTITNSYGCQAVSAPKVVVVNTPPNVTYPDANSSYPIGHTMTLNPQNSGGTPDISIQSNTILDTDLYALAIVADNDNIYYTDINNQTIKKRDANGVITTYGAPGDFSVPAGLAKDAAGNIYVSDNGTGAIKKIAADGTITTLYADLSGLLGIARDAMGNFYYSDVNSSAIKKINSDGTTTVLASDVFAYSFLLEDSGAIVIPDTNSNTIIRVTPSGTITTVANGFNGPIGIVEDSLGNIYVTDAYNSAIKKISPNGTVAPLANDLMVPAPLALDSANNLYTVTINDGNLRKLALTPAFSITPALPAGMVLNTQTGTISGTPTEETPYTEYQVNAQSRCGGMSTTFGFLTENPCTVIYGMQTNVPICGTVGATSSLHVLTSGPTATYTWQYRVPTKANPNPAWITITSANNAVYSNYNTSTLHITKTAKLPAVGTQYHVLVNSSVAGCSTLTSDTRTINILSTAKAGTISLPSTSVCLGGDLTLTVTGIVGTALQWQSSPISTAAAPGTWTDIPDAIGFTYTLTNAQLTSARSYRVVVTNSCNGTTAISATKTITVNPLSVAGTITGGGIVCRGGSGTVKVAGYTGKIQWEYSTDGGNTYLNAPKVADGQSMPFATTSTNSTAATYLLSAINSDCYLRAKVTSGACSTAYTDAVAYTIGESANVGTVAPDNALICSGTGTTLTLSSAYGTVTWEKSTSFASATPTWTATTNHAMTHNTGNLTMSTAYRAKVSIGSCSTVYSNIAYITIEPKPMAKPIVKNTTSPTGNTVATALCATSGSKILTAGAGTVGEIHWQHSTTSATTGFVDMEGATGTSYTLAFPNYINYTNNSGVNYYRMRVTNSCGTEVFGAAVAVYFKACGNEGDGTNWLKAKTFDVKAYPNPYSASFNLNLTTSNTDSVVITVYDMTGKTIEKFERNANEVSGLEVGNNYASGIYNVVVTQGNEVKALRVIKR